ncbi:MAG: hypothetical protein ACLSA6_17540 [Holdemania massiliensis]
MTAGLDKMMSGGIKKMNKNLTQIRLAVDKIEAHLFDENLDLMRSRPLLAIQNIIGIGRLQR